MSTCSYIDSWDTPTAVDYQQVIALAALLRVTVKDDWSCVLYFVPLPHCPLLMFVLKLVVLCILLYQTLEMKALLFQ